MICHLPKVRCGGKEGLPWVEENGSLFAQELFEFAVLERCQRGCNMNVLLFIIILVVTAPVGATALFDVRTHGAKCDGKSSDTAAIQTAIDKCGETGRGHDSGGTVRFGNEPDAHRRTRFPKFANVPTKALETSHVKELIVR